MESKVISGILAQALVTLPRIKMADLFEECKSSIGNITLEQFRADVSKWIKDGTIPGYESRKGPTGGIYKKGAPNESTGKITEDVDHDPQPTQQIIEVILLNQPRITVRDLFSLVCTFYPNLTENQFRPILSYWIDNDKIPGYELRKGPTGGVYKVDADSEKPLRIPFDTDGEESAGCFTMEISPNLRVIQSSERNWTIQKRSNENWVSYFYHPTLISALNSCVKHILNGEFKLAESTMINVKDAKKFLKEVEERIFEQLKNHAESIK
jgi:hypothetical protein